ncbi:shikimate dehydrogenase [Bosea sp. LjRoot9]|uniref:shikimate dehydrogenase n=1 Tax=Bosea sp. LjRoot9 TaxID=3342341 RepID=UPI003ECDE322
MQQPDRYLMAGVMGYPIMHSRSPVLHNYWLREHGLNGVYVPLAVKPEGLAAALRALPALGFSGCNLTMPLKELALSIVDRVSPIARQIGAMNCVIVAPDGSLEGHNFEAFGYAESLAQDVPGWTADAGPVIVIGAGGGARAVIAGLADRGATDIRICNRSAARAEQLAAEFGVKVLPWDRRHDAIGDAALLVNTTNQGMGKEQALDLDLAKLPPSAVVSDLIYVPRETPLLAAARARGNRTVNGLGMLLNQARPAFKNWFGVMPEITPGLRAAIEATL